MHRFLPSARRFIASVLVVLHLAALLTHGLSQTAQAADDLAKRTGSIVICTLQGVMLLNPADGSKQPVPPANSTAKHCALCLIPANIAAPPTDATAAISLPALRHSTLHFMAVDAAAPHGTTKRAAPPRAPPPVV